MCSRHDDPTWYDEREPTRRELIDLGARLSLLGRSAELCPSRDRRGRARCNLPAGHERWFPAHQNGMGAWS